MFINFVEAGQSKSGKTKRWRVVATSGACDLGEVKWFAHWRCYVFEPNPVTVFDSKCLDAISLFCKTQTKGVRDVKVQTDDAPGLQH
jgi:hypothetical protein